jgi:hypothetical protein
MAMRPRAWGRRSDRGGYSGSRVSKIRSPVRVQLKRGPRGRFGARAQLMRGEQYSDEYVTLAAS